MTSPCPCINHKKPNFTIILHSNKKTYKKIRMIFAEENRNIQRFLFDSFEHCARTVFMKITPVAVAIILLLISHFLTIAEKNSETKTVSTTQ